jgi:putative endonuclease
MKVFTSPTQRTGELGERIAADYLVKNKYTILERNYTCNLGEIDIIAEKHGILYFIEVKSRKMSVSNKGPTAEENMSRSKWQKMRKTIDMYFAHKNVSRATNFSTSLLAINFSEDKLSARVKHYKNIAERFM